MGMSLSVSGARSKAQQPSMVLAYSTVPITRTWTPIALPKLGICIRLFPSIGGSIWWVSVPQELALLFGVYLETGPEAREVGINWDPVDF